jgi:hypothetical protein
MATVNATSNSQEAPAIEPEAQSPWMPSVGGILLRILLGAAVTAAIIGAYILFSDKPPVITGEVAPVSTYFIHREMTPDAAGGGGMVGVHQPFDQVLVLANVKIHNQSKIPVFIHDLWAVVSLPDLDRRALAAGQSDFSRVFLAYPQMAPSKREPLVRDITIQPHSTAEGQLIFNYPLTKEQWDARHSFDISISFMHQRDLTIRAPQ